jgi:uncharacterized protein (TIGR02284 family)
MFNIIKLLSEQTHKGRKHMNEKEQPKLKDVGQKLLQALAENEEFYRTAANNLIQDQLHELFQERAEKRAEFAREIVSYLAEAEVNTEEIKITKVDLTDFMHRGFLTLKAAMTIERDKTDDVVINDSLAAERKLLAAYEAALQENLPASMDALLEKQYVSVKAAYTYIGTKIAEDEHPVIVGLFPDLPAVEKAVSALTTRGIPREDIGVIAEDDVVEKELADKRADMAKEGAGAGGILGGAIGGTIGVIIGTAITLSFGPILILGIPVFAGVTLAGTAIGASHGALAGALLGWGMGEDDVHSYIESVRNGQILLVVKVDTEEAAQEVSSLLQQVNGARVATRHESFSEFV